MNAIRKFRQLSSAERGLLLNAGILLAAYRVALWVLPFATLCYGGQALYYRVFHAYVGRDTVRLGIELRGEVNRTRPFLAGRMYSIFLRSAALYDIIPWQRAWQYWVITPLQVSLPVPRPLKNAWRSGATPSESPENVTYP